MTFPEWAAAIVAGVRVFLPDAQAVRKGQRLVVIRHGEREALLANDGSFWVTFTAGDMNIKTTVCSLVGDRRDVFTARLYECRFALNRVLVVLGPNLTESLLASKPLQLRTIGKDTLSPAPDRDPRVGGHGVKRGARGRTRCGELLFIEFHAALAANRPALRVAVLQQGRHWAARELVAGFLHRW
jgi:hypothetical protein